jgi:hypothetical protein
MTVNLILHISGEEPVVGEADEIPGPGDVTVKVSNPHRVDGKELSYLSENVTIVIYPMVRMNFIEIMPSREEEELIGFVRE